MSLPARRSRDARSLESQLIRESLQQHAAALIGWGALIARAADISPPDDIVEVIKGARKSLIAAIDDAKALAEIEGSER